MYKPQSLRNHIIRQVPALARDPDKLSLFVKDGRLASTGTQSLSFEYAYTLEITVLDYAGHPDTVFVPVLQWLKVHQRDLFDNPDTQSRAVRFEAEYLNHSAIDLLIHIDLSERVIARKPATPGGAMRLHHAPEPQRVGSTPNDAGWTGGTTTGTGGGTGGGTSTGTGTGGGTSTGTGGGTAGGTGGTASTSTDPVQHWELWVLGQKLGEWDYRPDVI